MLARDSYLRGVRKIQQSVRAKTAADTNRKSFRWRKNTSTMTNSDSSLEAGSPAGRNGSAVCSVIRRFTFAFVRACLLEGGSACAAWAYCKYPMFTDRLQYLLTG